LRGILAQIPIAPRCENPRPQRQALSDWTGNHKSAKITAVEYVAATAVPLNKHWNWDQKIPTAQPEVVVADAA
jgi:hypothetical protein